MSGFSLFATLMSCTPNSLSDPTAVSALTTIRAYLNGLSTANVPPEGALVSKQSFVTLVGMLADTI
jgi:hypothetical protein